MHPPWLEENENVDLIPGDKKVLSLNTSVKGGTSRKLNPKRVGAAWAEKRRVELEMEKSGQMVDSDYDDNWLPNFGRVWQEGTRKDSRKEFEREKYQSRNADPEVSTKLQPYISKRMVNHSLQYQIDVFFNLAQRGVSYVLSADATYFTIFSLT